MYRLLPVGLILGCIAAASVVRADEVSASRRIGNGLLALYDFRETQGPLVNEQSAIGDPHQFIGNAPAQVRNVVTKIEAITNQHTEAAAYRPGSIL